jgi:hypothetical protein
MQKESTGKKIRRETGMWKIVHGASGIVFEFIAAWT